jgi:hypothetical protein
MRSQLGGLVRGLRMLVGIFLRGGGFVGCAVGLQMVVLGLGLLVCGCLVVFVSAVSVLPRRYFGGLRAGGITMGLLRLRVGQARLLCGLMRSRIGLRGMVVCMAGLLGHVLRCSIRSQGSIVGGLRMTLALRQICVGRLCGLLCMRPHAGCVLGMQFSLLGICPRGISPVLGLVGLRCRTGLGLLGLRARFLQLNFQFAHKALHILKCHVFHSFCGIWRFETRPAAH